MSASPPRVTAAPGEGMLRRLDHIAIAVHDTERALEYFKGTLGLQVVHVDELDEPPVTLTYLDAGNIFIQLVSPRRPCEIATWLDRHGEGLHHVCFAVDDVVRTVELLSNADEPTQVGSGRGRVASFIRNGSPFGVLIECTEFHEADGPARPDGREPN